MIILPGSSPLARGLPARAERLAAAAGSSPLARGLHPETFHFLDDQGIIPARAGFTRPHFTQLIARTDHPRSRGVYTPCRARGTSSGGSSPLARGLLTVRGEVRDTGGIIPARAGFTYPGRTTTSAIGDHPRSRGVYAKPVSDLSGKPGSSPLARGLLLVTFHSHDGVGIIPARAGFTLSMRVPLSLLPDHPRSRGVYCAIPTVIGSL